jgi:hypothetical protein
VTLSIVLLGNLLVDDVVLADGTIRMGQPGGALLYGALGATLGDARPGLVSVLGNDYPEEILATLHERGADLRGLRALGRSACGLGACGTAEARAGSSWLAYVSHRRGHLSNHLGESRVGPQRIQIRLYAQERKETISFFEGMIEGCKRRVVLTQTGIHQDQVERRHVSFVCLCL